MPTRNRPAAGAAPAGDAGPISKTRRKSEMHSLQKLGVALIELDDADLRELPLPERLYDAIVQARSIRAHEGRRRQLQFIGRLMRDVDPEPIQACLDRRQQNHQVNVAAHHEAELWRDRLIAGDTQPDEFVQRHGNAVDEPIARLVQLARRERDDQQPPKQARLLYRALHRVLSAETPS